MKEMNDKEMNKNIAMSKRCISFATFILESALYTKMSTREMLAGNLYILLKIASITSNPKTVIDSFITALTKSPIYTGENNE